jgi:TRAP-type C4-dicarboxylate transport system substrate-binding protein
MRKTILTVVAASLIAAGASLTGSVAPAAAQMVDGPEVSWKLSAWGKRRAFTEGAEYVSAQVAERTGGKFTIKLFYGQQLSKSKENLDGISLGAFEAAMFCASYHPGKNAPLNVLDLPFLPLADFAVMRKVHDVVYAHPSAHEALSKWNAYIFMSNILPQYEYMGRGKPPQSVSDFEGKRLRALGGMGRAAKMIGATPSTMPASETYTALQRGTVDAIGFPYSYTFASYKLDEVADWVTTNMSLGTVNCPTVFNVDAWNALPEQYKELLLSLKDGAYTAMDAAYKEKDIVNEKKWREGGKIQMVQIPEEEMAEFRRIAGEPAWNAWVEENKDKIPAQELLDLVLSTAKAAM